MRHDKRDDGGMYRPLSDAEERHMRAREETQTHSGPFTHEREASKRRMPLDAIQYSAPYFKDRRFNRDGYHPKVGKAP
jgi:hypothetical protein